MRIGGLDYPEKLLTALRSGQLVVFAGAGVSMGHPANLPSFAELAREIAEGTGETRQENEPDDRFLGRLEDQGVNVHSRAVEILTRSNPRPTDLHSNLLRLFSELHQVRLVTTNFDSLFEEAAKTVFGGIPQVSQAPALPLGRDFHGIVHVHGAIADPNAIVITDTDFGRAYLTDGWATRFIVELFRQFTVLFVGYSHSDVVTNYLARALSRAEKSNRFALVDQNEDLRRWSAFDVTAISYSKPSPGDFNALYVGVEHLAKLVRRGILDWEREVGTLANQAPPTDEETAALVELALKEPATTRFFTAKARSPEWVSWLHSRKLLEPLFGDEPMREHELVLASWLAEHHAISHAQHVWLLISKHRNRIHPDFWTMLCRELGRSESDLLDVPTLSSWVSLLLECAPHQLLDSFALQWVAERCAKKGATQATLAIFAKSSESSLVLAPATQLPGEETDTPRVRGENELRARHHSLQELWTKGLKPQIKIIAEDVLALISRRLTQRHERALLWHTAGENWDSDSLGRSAIEPDAQDRYPEALDVLIDAARDSLEWLAEANPKRASNWEEQFAVSRTPLLRRLAIHALLKRSDLSSDEKLASMLARGVLFDRGVHHEAYRAIKLAYAGATDTAKGEVIEAISSYRSPEVEDPNAERHAARLQYDWFSWLRDAAPECKRATEALERIQGKYPMFASKDHPDFTTYVSDGWVGPETPLTVEQLLAAPLPDLLPELLTFKGEARPFGPDRNGLLRAIGDSAKGNQQWGFDLARLLVDQEQWTTDIWEPLFRAWTETNLQESHLRTVFEWLSLKALQKSHASTIAGALYSFVKDGGRQDALAFLEVADSIARNLWLFVDRSQVETETDGWLSRALNRAAGELALYWVNSISIWRKSQEPKPSDLGERYRAALTELVEDETVAGGLARAVLASQLAFFLAIDGDWSRRYLVPLFGKVSDKEKFQQAWDGFLTWGRLTPSVVEALEQAFLTALTTLSDALKGRRDRFIEFFTSYLAFHASDPIGTWIPQLFKHGGNDVGTAFTGYIEQILRGLAEPHQTDLWQRWLRKYWENRLVGIPAPLTADEIEGMVEWLPSLSAVFPSAVDLAVQMPVATLHRSLVLHVLAQDETTLLERYPEPCARFTLYLGRFEAAGYVWSDLAKIIGRLNEHLPESAQRPLRELATKLGVQ